MPQIENQTQNKKTPDLERLLICNPKMVHLVYFVSNTFWGGYPS